MERCIHLEDLVWSDYEILLQNQNRYEEIMKILELKPISS